MSAERTIEMVEEALQANEPASASELYESAARVRHTALRLAQSLPTVHVSEVRGSITPGMEVLFDQLAHCRAKLSELEDL